MQTKHYLLGILVLVSTIILFISCLEDQSVRGAQAAKEFCECLEEHSASYCEDELDEKYHYKDFADEEFIDAFNEAQTCGAHMSKK